MCDEVNETYCEDVEIMKNDLEEKPTWVLPTVTSIVYGSAVITWSWISNLGDDEIVEAMQREHDLDVGLSQENAYECLSIATNCLEWEIITILLKLVLWKKSRAPHQRRRCRTQFCCCINSLF